MGQTASQIIEAKGGVAPFAAAIGASPEAVRMMKCRNRLSRSFWPQIAKAYPELTLDRLTAAERAGTLQAQRAA